jgi:hypothetical protein
MLSSNSIPAPNPNVVGRMVDGEAVLVLPDQGQVKVLNPVGARIWSLADGSRSIAQIAQVICDEYEVDPEQAQADVLEFFARLEDKGVVSFS